MHILLEVLIQEQNAKTTILKKKTKKTNKQSVQFEDIPTMATHASVLFEKLIPNTFYFAEVRSSHLSRL